MSSFQDDLSSTDHIVEYTLYLGNATDVDWQYTGYIATYDDALLLQMPNQSSGTVLSSTKYFWFGKIGATIKTSRGNGVITAFITFSDVQDEIDYEFVGYNLTAAETNYYSQGILNYTNVRETVLLNTFENWHYYEIDWTEDQIEWIIDGAVVRTLKREDTWNSTTDRYDFPLTPSRIQFSLWPAGTSSSALGTVEWAGGEIDWNSEDMEEYGYYYMQVKNFTADVYELPTFAQTLNGKNVSDYQAFLYNSTEGDEWNVYLTNKKTWLGSADATGLDPQNEDTELVVTILSGLTVMTSTSTRTATAATSAQNPATDAQGATTGLTSVSTATGFMQDSLESSTAASSSAGKSADHMASLMAAAFAAALAVFMTGY